MVDEKKQNYKIFIIITIIIGILLIAMALYFYFSKADRKELGKDYSIGDLSQNVTDSLEEGRNLVEEINSINKNYPEAVAWLKVLGTSIDTPVFKSEDNEKYLRNDRDNITTRWGENFLDYTCDLSKIEEKMQHYIIYGHNTEVDTRFTPLLNYKDSDFFNEHQIIELATLEKTYKFQIFSAYKTTTDFYYIENEFNTEDEYKSFLESIKSKSEYDTSVEITTDDNILTLSTCDYSIENGRYVVHAKLIK